MKLKKQKMISKLEEITFIIKIIEFVCMIRITNYAVQKTMAKPGHGVDIIWGRETVTTIILIDTVPSKEIRYTHLISNARLKKSGQKLAQIITPYLMKMATFAGLITLQCLMNGCQTDVLIRIVKLSMMEYGIFLLISDLILIVLSRAPWDGTGRPRTVLVLGTLTRVRTRTTGCQRSILRIIRGAFLE